MCKQGMFSAPMAGEISPNVMFFGIRRKDSQMHANTCMMGLDGRSWMGGHGGTGKRVGKRLKRRLQDVFYNV